MSDRPHRRIARRLAALAAVAAMAAAGGPGAAEPGEALGTPKSTVETLHGGLVEASKAGASVQDRFERLLPLIRATHDIAYIAELTVRRQWRDMQPAQRERFVAAFERLSAMTYAARFGAVTPETFRLTGTSEAGGERVEVSALIVRENAPDIPLDYVLHERDGVWRIVNIVADGVSDLALKRAEYQRILAGGGVADLVAHLQDQIAGLEEEAGSAGEEPGEPAE